MKKRMGMMIILCIALALPGMAIAFGGWSWGEKSLCEFPFGQWGFFRVKYDLRIYHHDYFINSYPPGGINFQFYVGGYPTAEERDAMADKIFWVRYTNKTNGDTHLITKADKYNYLGETEDLEYSIHIGKKSKAEGEWKMVVATKMGRYTASFTIDEDDLEQEPPIPSDDILVIVDAWPRVLSWELDSDDHRFSILDGEDFIWQSRWRNNPNCQLEGVRCTMIFDFPPDPELIGKTARIEHRKNGQSWPMMMPGDNCQAYDMGPGGQSRAMYYIEVEPPPEIECNAQNLGREKYVEVIPPIPPGFSCLGSIVCINIGTPEAPIFQWTDPPAGCAPEDFNECGGTAPLPGKVNESCDPGNPDSTFQCGPDPNDIFCIDPINPPEWWPLPWSPPLPPPCPPGCPAACGSCSRVSSPSTTKPFLRQR